MTTIYKKKNFKIYDYGKGFIVHNSNLEFEYHHSHINNFHTCKYIIDLCIHKTVPYHLSDYLLVSILRLTEDESYKNKIMNILEKSNSKKNKSYNNGNIPSDIHKGGKKNERKRSNRSKRNNSKSS